MDKDTDFLDKADDHIHDSVKRILALSNHTKKCDVADEIGVSVGVFSNWSKRGVSKEGALTAGRVYNVDANYIMYGGENPSTLKHTSVQIIPVFSKVSLNNYKSLDDDAIVDWIALPKGASEHAFAILLDNRSMSPEFSVGDTVVIDLIVDDKPLKDGEFVLAQYQAESKAELKQVVLGSGSNECYLAQLNKDIPNSVVSTVDFNMIGRVIQRITKY